MKTTLVQENRRNAAAFLALLVLLCFVCPVPVEAAVVNSKAFAASNRVMEYLIAQRDAGKIISGQQQKIIWGTRTDEEAEHVYAITSPQVYPALLGFDVGCVSPLITSNGIPMSTVRADMAATAINYWQMGALITYSWHQTSPKDATPDVGGFGSSQAHASMSNAEFHDVVTPGTTLYNRWAAHVDLIAPYLKQLRDAGVVVLWRPYHEMNPAFFWWSARPAADYQQLWINLYDRLVNYHGLNNLIWVWGPHRLTTNVAQFYPGSAYVDISGVDIYTSVPSSTSYTAYPSTLTSAAPGKPYTLAECGLFPQAASITNTDYLWFLCWTTNFIDNTWGTTGYPATGQSDGNTPASTAAFYNQPFTITLDEVNFPRSFEAELVPSRVTGGTKTSPTAVTGATNDNVFVHDAVGAGNSMEFDVTLPGNGAWAISGSLGRMNNRPQVQASVAGTTVGPVVDLYTADTAPVYSTINLGSYVVTEGFGTTTLKLTVTGKNGSSSGYRTSVDNLTFTKTASLLFGDRFEDGNATGWTPTSGTWSVVTDGTYRYAQTSTAAVTHTTVPTMGTATDLTLSVDVKITALGSSAGAVSCAFRYTDINNYYTWQLRPSDNQLRFYKVVGGVATQIGSSVPFTVALNTTYNLQVVASGSTLTGFVDGVQKLQVTDSTFASGQIALRVSTLAVRYDNVTVTTP